MLAVLKEKLFQFSNGSHLFHYIKYNLTPKINSIFVLNIINILCGI